MDVIPRRKSQVKSPNGHSQSDCSNSVSACVCCKCRESAGRALTGRIQTDVKCATRTRSRAVNVKRCVISRCWPLSSWWVVWWAGSCSTSTASTTTVVIVIRTRWSGARRTGRRDATASRATRTNVRRRPTASPASSKILVTAATSVERPSLNSVITRRWMPRLLYLILALVLESPSTCLLVLTAK